MKQNSSGWANKKCSFILFLGTLGKKFRSIFFCTKFDLLGSEPIIQFCNPVSFLALNYAASALWLISSSREMILVAISLSNNPDIPAELTSVNGDSNSIAGSIVPFTERKLMIRSMNRICWEFRFWALNNPAKATFAALISSPRILRMNLPKGWSPKALMKSYFVPSVPCSNSREDEDIGEK